jgi:hypothetical protein
MDTTDLIFNSFDPSEVVDYQAADQSPMIR